MVAPQDKDNKVHKAEASMGQPSSLAIWQAGADVLACGRSCEEQRATIRQFGSHAVTPVLRTRLLAGLGIAKAREQAENCIIFGCYRPFADPFLVRDYLRVLECLHVDYTYLDQEQCCGMPFAMMPHGAERAAALIESQSCNQRNDQEASKKGARRLAYCCMGCAYAARSAFPEAQARHVYIPDLIFDQVQARALAIAPRRIGYFEGCHTFAKSAYPAGAFDWGRYRRHLETIDGLTLVDLPRNRCCKTGAEALVHHAVEHNVTSVLCPCNSCASTLGLAGQGQITMISLPELLLEALGVRAK